MNKYYTSEPVNIPIQSFINIIQENHTVITTKKGKGKLPLFCGNGERFIPIYAQEYCGYMRSITFLSLICS